MVKNTTGGNKAKGQARKFVSASKQSRSLRVSTDESEIYAKVSKYMGNSMCHVICTDGITRLCHIRGKFRGRGKRDNMVSVGSWLLVGLRDWETEKKDKMEQCDLLEVYNDVDKESLKNIKTVNWSIFTLNDIKEIHDEEGIGFSTDQTEEHRLLMEEEMLKNKDDSKKTIIAFGEDEEIDVEDI
jgi:translation initiation factor 1A